MTLRPLSIALLLAAASASTTATATAPAAATQPAPSASTGVAVPPASVTAQVPAMLRAAHVPGVAIARIEHGRLAWTGAFGERAPGQPMTRDTVFNVASLTKPVFALMSLQLVAQGRIGLDTPVARYWVDPDVASDPRRGQLTPRLLLSHQSGLPNWRGGEPLAFGFTPGERHEYSGEGYEYLRRALERLTGEPMTATMASTVLKQVPMPHTAFGWNPRLASDLAPGTMASGRPYADTDLDTRGPNAAANMLTTVGDYGRFAAWVARGADLPPSLFAEMMRPQSLRSEPAEHFGLGWRVIDVNGHAVLSHDGRERGVRTQIFVEPDTGDGLVVLTASDNGALLTRPLVQATWPGADALLGAIDRDVWTYLQRMPHERLPAVARAMVESPAFMSQFLHAADAGLIQPSPLPAATKQRTPGAIDAFVLAMLDGKVARRAAETLVERLVVQEGGAPGWRDSLDADAAAEWVASLSERATAPARVDVPRERLARYAGRYRLASNDLLITIALTPGGLEASAKGMPAVKLHAESPTLFGFDEDSTRFEFLPGADGHVPAVRLIWSASRSEVARRVE